jgi:hypothetical protein
MQYGKAEGMTSVNAWEKSPLYSDGQRAAVAWTEELTPIADSGVARGVRGAQATHCDRSLPRVDPVFGDGDPGTRVMLEGILVVEEEHANDMHDLLVAREGRPSLDE